MLLVVRGLLGVVVVLRVIGGDIVRGILGGVVARIHLIDVLVLHCGCACRSIDLLVVRLTLVVNLFLVVVLEAPWLVRIGRATLVAPNDRHMLLVIIVHIIIIIQKKLDHILTFLKNSLKLIPASSFLPLAFPSVNSPPSSLDPSTFSSLFS